MGMPTERLLRIVESNDTSTHLTASDKLVDEVITRRRIDLGLDEVGLCVGSEEAGRFARDLSSEDEGSIEDEVAAFQVSCVALFDLPRGVRNESGDVEHRSRGPQIRPAVVGLAPLLQRADDRLSPGETAGAEQNDDAIPRALEDRHLAELRKVVDARVRARVRSEDDARVQECSDTVRHAVSSLWFRPCV
jgi:hypothetical protein